MPGVDGRQRRWTDPSPSDFDRWELRIANGEDWCEAATAEGHTTSAFGRSDPKRHAEIKALWRDVSRENDRARSRHRLLAEADNMEAEPKDRIRAAELLGKSSGYLTDAAKLEVSGPEGGPIELAVQEAHEQLAAGIARIADRRAAADGPGDADA